VLCKLKSLIFFFFSSHWSIWVPALYFDFGFADSYTARHCSCNGWNLCEYFTIFMFVESNFLCYCFLFY